MNDKSNLKREIQAMPDDIRDHLEARDLMAEYEARPAFQQNDYLGWISRAKRESTREKRIEQMLEELANGGVYMRMKHSPSA